MRSGCRQAGEAAAPAPPGVELAPACMRQHLLVLPMPVALACTCFSCHMLELDDQRAARALPLRRQARRVQRVADFWLGEVLLPGDTLAAAGVAFHLADLLLPELAKCVAEGSVGAAPDDATLRMLLEPFCRALAGAATPAMIHRLR